MIRSVIFDADGVLINAERFSTQLERQYGIPSERVTPFFNGIFQECLVGREDLKVAIQPHLREWGWRGTVEDLLHFWFTSEHKIDTKILELVISLRESVPVFMATNQELYRTGYMAKEMGFNSIFTEIYSSAGVGHLKSSKEFFNTMLSDVRNRFVSDIQPNEVLFFDDAPENIKSAKELGVQGVLYTGVADLRGALKDFNLISG